MVSKQKEQCNQKRINYLYDSTGAIRKINIPPKFTKDLLFLGDTCYRVGHLGVTVEYKNRICAYSNIENSLFWCTSVLKKGSKILLGTKNGLLCLKDSTVLPFSDSIAYLQVSISSLASFRDFVLVGTKSYGLIMLKNDTVYDVINK